MTAALPPQALRFVLFSLSRAELLEQVQALDITFPGSRPGSIPAEDLVDALVDEYGKDAAAAARIAAAVERKLPSPDLSFLGSKKGYRAFKGELEEAGPADIARLLWHLVKDPRPEAKQAFEAVVDTMDDRVDELDEQYSDEALRRLAERAKEAEGLERRLQEALQADRHKEKRLAELSRALEEARRRGEQAQSEAASLKEVVKRLEARLRESERALEGARGGERLGLELAEAAKRIEALRGELAAAEEKLRRQGRLRRVGVFVDVQNLVISARDAFGAGIDFKALYRKVAEGGEGGDRLIVEACAYLAEDPLQEKRGLKGALKQAGFQVKTRPIIYRADGSSKGNWDLGMAVEVIERADRLDAVVLGTGDGDFEDIVRFLKEKKPHLAVEILCLDSPTHTSERLLKAADRVHRLGSKHMLEAKAPGNA